jgi:hypothetical protein
MRLRLAPIALALASCGPAATAGPPTAGGTTPSTVVASEGAVNAGSPLAAPPTPTPTPAGAAREIITVRPAFQPDPIVRQGTAGGPIPASTHSEECPGYVAAEPTFLLKVERSMPDLRILVSTSGDAVLVVELSDGRVLCNDDSEGLNPIVEGAMPQGRHRVWVGTYGETAAGSLPFVIGFTSQLGLLPSQLGGMPPTP